FQAADGIRDRNVTGVQTCALPILSPSARWRSARTASATTASRPSTSARPPERQSIGKAPSWLRLRGGLVSGRGTARGLHRPLPEHPPTTREDPLEPADRPGEGEPVLSPYDPVRGVLREARASDVRSVPSHARDEAAAVRL